MIDGPRLINAGISTMWAITKFSNLSDFCATVKSFGFQQVELNHQVDNRLLATLNFDHIQFSSVHEPCPADIPTKELADRDWLISSADADKRTLGVKEVKKSIDLAHHLHAPIVVVHCGSIPFTQNHEAVLRSLFRSSSTASGEFKQVKEQFEQARRGLVKPRLAAVKQSLNELLDYATQRDVKLGLENRYHFMDIPSIDEMGELLTLASPGQLGFIYDVGHAQAMDRLGFYPHADWLKRYSARILGAHLHDVIGLTDHQAPGLGEIEFRHIANYLPENSFRTCELLPHNTPAEVERGIKVLLASGCIKYL